MAAKKKVVEEVDEAVDEAEDAIGSAMDDAESWIERQLLATRERARDEPITMLALAAGVGALIGALFLR